MNLKTILKSNKDINNEKTKNLIAENYSNFDDLERRILSSVSKIQIEGVETQGNNLLSLLFQLSFREQRPLEISKAATSYDVKCSVKGGGLSGQAGAIILGISKALIAHDEGFKKSLKKDKLTTRDSRVVERKKYGHRKARRSFQFSKR